MTEIAKCACGAEASASGLDGEGDSWVFCSECGWSGQLCPSVSEAVVAWNRVMRARPVVHENKYAPHVGCAFVFEGTNPIGEIACGTGVWVAYCGREKHKGESRHPIEYAKCRSWLIGKLTDAGFDVRTAPPEAAA